MLILSHESAAAQTISQPPAVCSDPHLQLHGFKLPSEGLQLIGQDSHCPGHACVHLLSETAWQGCKGTWLGSGQGLCHNGFAEFETLSSRNVFPKEFLYLSLLSCPFNHQIVGMLPSTNKVFSSTGATHNGVA